MEKIKYIKYRGYEYPAPRDSQVERFIDEKIALDAIWDAVESYPSREGFVPIPDNTLYEGRVWKRNHSVYPNGMSHWLIDEMRYWHQTAGYWDVSKVRE